VWAKTDQAWLAAAWDRHSCLSSATGARNDLERGKIFHLSFFNYHFSLKMKREEVRRKIMRGFLSDQFNENEKWQMINGKSSFLFQLT
jgi:hypothetical protein